MTALRSIPAALLISAAALLAVPTSARAVDFGVRTGIYTDASEAFVGVDALAQVGGAWFFNPNFEYVFVDDGDLFTLNGDFHYDFPVDGPTYVWAGGGPALIFRDLDDRRRDDDSETDFGLNLLAGVGWKAAGLVPYVQGKVIVSDDTEAVIAFGVRF